MRAGWRSGGVVCLTLAACGSGGSTSGETSSAPIEGRAPTASARQSASAYVEADVRIRFEVVGMPEKVETSTDVRIDRKPIAIRLAEAQPALAACHAGAPGETWIALEVGKSGEAKGARVVRTSGSSTAAECALKAVEKIAFGGQANPVALSVWLQAPYASRMGEIDPCPRDEPRGHLAPCPGAGNMAGDSIGDAASSPPSASAATSAAPSASTPPGTLGHGSGDGMAPLGPSTGRFGSGHRPKPPSVRMGPTSVKGKLPPEVIQRVVRQSFGRFRLCYENALRDDPRLEGRVTTFFTIEANGSVTIKKHESTIKEPAVGECVAKGFKAISFPSPEGGVVDVSFPISFSSGEPARVQSVTGLFGAPLAELTGAKLSEAVTRGTVRAAEVTGSASAAVPFVVFVEVGSDHYAVTRVPIDAPRPDGIALVDASFAVVVMTSGSAPLLSSFLAP